MEQAQYSKLFSFLWNIANDVLVHAFEKAKKGQEHEIEYAKNRKECERIPLTYPGGIEAFYENEVAPYDSEARFGEPVLGYELSFTKYFYKPVELRALDAIMGDIRTIELNTK